MTKPIVTLPRLITTSVVRGSSQGESHGGIYLVDFNTQQVDQVVDWNTADIDFTGRGWDRGLRGIAFDGDDIYIAASDELFVYDRNFKIQRSFRNSYLKHCHEISRLDRHLYLTSTGHESILAFDLDKQAFVWAIHLAISESGPAGNVYDPNGLQGPGGAKGPPARNTLHLNNIYTDQRGLFVSGMRTQGMLHVASGGKVSQIVDLPEGIHNARPYGEGVIFNDTAANCLRYAKRDGTEKAFAVTMYEHSELTHTELGDDKLARQGFGRGLCIVPQPRVKDLVGKDLVAGGSSPSTISLYDIDSGATLARVNFSMDIRNAIHGLEVWPFD